MNAWHVVGLLLTAAIGIWRFVKRMRNEKTKRAEAALKLAEEGRVEKDVSKITAAVDDLNRIE